MASTNGNIDPARALSVTADDAMRMTDGAIPVNGLGYYFFLSPYGSQSKQAINGLPRYYSREGDYYLRETIFMEDMWAGAIARAVTKIVSMSWEVSDKNDSSRNTRAAQDLLHNVDGGDGWDSFLTKLVLDFLLTDNGCHFEIVRAGNAPGGKVLGLFHLDSCRTYRTGNPEYPARYMDLMGVYHALAWWQVVSFSDLEHTDSRLFGVGRCAARRCIASITLLAALTGHASERVLGAGNTVIHLITGVSRQSLEAAIRDSEQTNLQRGRLYYKGALLIPLELMDATPQVASIQLAGLPDNFNATDLRTDGYHKYANNIGIPITDVIPLTGQGLGTGTQSRVIDERAEGIGLASFMKRLARALNNARYGILPKTTQYAWDEHDLRDEKARADAASARASERKTRVDSGEITAQQALQLAVDANDAPASFLPAGDETPGGELTDTEKPEEMSQVGQDAQPQVTVVLPVDTTPMSTEQPIAPVVPVQKSMTTDELFERELQAAMVLSRTARAA